MTSRCVFNLRRGAHLRLHRYWRYHGMPMWQLLSAKPLLLYQVQTYSTYWRKSVRRRDGARDINILENL